MSCLHCELPKLLEASRPPDHELLDLIEQAFLVGQIDGVKADLAYLWLQEKQRQSSANCYPYCYPKNKGLHPLGCNPLIFMARPERFELPTTWFEARYSIQLSYGRYDFYFVRQLVPSDCSSASRCKVLLSSLRSSSPATRR